MAIVQINVATDMRTFAGYDFSAQLGNSWGWTSSPTSWDLRTSAGYFHLLQGVGLSGGSTLPNLGTVTAWNFGTTQQIDPADPFTRQDYRFWTFTGLSVPAADFSAQGAFNNSQGSFSFAQTMKDAIAGVDAEDRAAGERMAAVDAGKSDDLVGAMLASQQASLSFSMLMQVRNKVMGAVDELLKLPV